MRPNDWMDDRDTDNSTPAPCRERMTRARNRWPGRGLALLVVTAMAGLPWLPLGDPSPEERTMHPIGGAPGVVLLGLAVSPVERLAVTIDDRGGVILHRIDESGAGRRLDIPGFAVAAAFSPDGRWLAVGRLERDVLLVDVGSGSVQRVLGIPTTATKRLVFSPDGRTLAVWTGESGEVLLWNIEASQPLYNGQRCTAGLTSYAFSPDGRSMAIADAGSGNVAILDKDTGDPVRTLDTHAVTWLGFSPDGRSLATLSTEFGLELWEFDTGRLLRIIGKPVPSIHWAAFSPDGRILAAAHSDRIVRLWDVGTGREVCRLRGPRTIFRRVSFTADGRSLLAIGMEYGLFRCDLDGSFPSVSDPIGTSGGPRGQDVPVPASTPRGPAGSRR